MRTISSLLFIFFLSTMCLAQEKEAKSTTPTLNGHRFILNGYVHDPFIYTGFKMELGVGLSEDYELINLPVLGYELKLRGGNNIYTTLNAGYHQKINDWAMIYGTFGVLGRLGTETGSLVANGLNSITGSTYGMKFKLFETEKSILSTEFEVKNYNSSYVNVLQYLIDIIEDNPRAALTQNINSLYGNIGAQYAYAFNDLMGLYGTLRYSFGDSVLPGEKVNHFNYGLAFDVNLSARTDVPLGASLGVMSATIPEMTLATSPNTTMTNLRLVYTGRNDLQIGLNISTFKAKYKIYSTTVPLDIDTNVINSSLTLNYFF